MSHSQQTMTLKCKVCATIQNTSMNGIITSHNSINKKAYMGRSQAEQGGLR